MWVVKQGIEKKRVRWGCFNTVTQEWKFSRHCEKIEAMRLCKVLNNQNGKLRHEDKEINLRPTLAIRLDKNRGGQNDGVSAAVVSNQRLRVRRKRTPTIPFPQDEAPVKRNRLHRPHVQYAIALVEWKKKKEADPNTKEKPPKHPASHRAVTVKKGRKSLENLIATQRK